MNINKISNFKSFIQKQINARKEKQISKYLRIDDLINSDARAQIYTARHGIANYAKANGVSVDIYGPAAANGSCGTIGIMVTNLSNNFKKINLLSADTNAKHIHTNFPPKQKTDEHFIIFDLTDNQSKYSYEDNFLRNIFRHISNLTNDVTAKSKK